MKREFIRPRAPREQEQEEDITLAPQRHVDEMDALLDEIDGVLEENAESFVQGFIQKGGQ
ncbi:MAG: ubiquitin-like protein Pup [Bowdeniella nasicola]|nr:ubiquitin-like protein Pup [Bowdeniella nasicola]